jgi:hypothetical protein
MPKRTHNKSEFVRSLPAEMSAKDVVVKAREEGVVLTEAYVHTIRSAAKRKEGKVGKPGRAPRATASAPEPRSGGSSRANTGAEAQLMALVIEHGLPQVQEILRRIDTKLRTLV